MRGLSFIFEISPRDLAVLTVGVSLYGFAIPASDHEREPVPNP